MAEYHEQLCRVACNVCPIITPIFQPGYFYYYNSLEMISKAGKNYLALMSIVWLQGTFVNSDFTSKPGGKN